MSKAPATLEELVAPLSEAQFLALLKRRELTLLRAQQRDRYAKLLSWDMLRRMLERGEHPTNLKEISLARESLGGPAERWLIKDQAGNNKIDVASIEAYLNQGFSLVITRIDAYAPHLTALCDDIRARSFEQIKIGVVVTSGKFGAFKLHYDPEDLIILQVEGRKRWKIFGPPVSNPVIGMAPQSPPPEDAPLFDEMLEPGDFLFVPGGNWHRCENGPNRSVHLGFFFQPPTGWHFIKALMPELMSEEIFRMPLTRLGGASALAAMEADLKARAIEKINGVKFDEYFAELIKARGP